MPNKSHGSLKRRVHAFKSVKEVRNPTDLVWKLIIDMIGTLGKIHKRSTMLSNELFQGVVGLAADPSSVDDA
jgi:hypothetical protein